MAEQTPPKPQTHNGDLRRLPRPLAHLGNKQIWVCWKWWWDPEREKWTKPPYRADDPGSHASTSNPSTWSPYQTALKQVLDGKADGLGFSVKGANIGGIDLDHCRDPETQEIAAWGREYIDQCPGAYVEATVSGKGLRILGGSDISLACKFKLPDLGNGAAVELFSNSTHYLTLSCNEIGSCRALPPIGKQMAAIAARLGRPKTTNGSTPQAADAATASPKKTEGEAWSFAKELKLRSALGAIPADEKMLTEKLGSSHNAWVAIGMAIERYGLDGHGYTIYRDWSTQSKEYNEEGLRKQWRSFQQNRDTRANPITIGTVFHYARQFGWNDQRPPGLPGVETRAHGDGKEPAQPDLSECSTFTAVELEQEQFEPVKSVVPGVFVEGLTLFCGKPKGGKSWLMLHASHAVALAGGGFTLGATHCVEGDVLYCSLEDNKRRLQGRLRKLFGRQPRPPRLHFKIKLPRLAQGGLTMLREWIGSVPQPRMIVIDTLAMVRMPNRKDQSVYDADYGAVVELRNLAHEFGIAVVVVHHVRKMEADDAFDTVSGTLGLTGCPDAIVILKRDATGAMLLGKGRDLEEFESALEWNKAGCTWRIAGDAAEVRLSAQQQTITEALREAGEPQTPKQIAAMVGMKQRNVQQLMRKMADQGTVAKIGYGKYEIAPKATKADPEF
jgi:hypothetical protein